jgi:hypothetical protein
MRQNDNVLNLARSAGLLPADSARADLFVMLSAFGVGLVSAWIFDNQLLSPAVQVVIVLIGVSCLIFAVFILVDAIAKMLGRGRWRQEVIPPYVPPKARTEYRFIPTNTPASDDVKALTMNMVEDAQHVTEDANGSEVDLYDLALFVAAGAAEDQGGGGVGYGQKKWRDNGPVLPSTGEPLKPAMHGRLIAEMDRALSVGGYFSPAVGTKAATLHCEVGVALRVLGIWQFAPHEYQ